MRPNAVSASRAISVAWCPRRARPIATLYGPPPGTAWKVGGGAAGRRSRMASPMPVTPACCVIRPPYQARRAYRARLDFIGPRADTGQVSTVVEFLFVIMLPTAAVFALIGAWRLAGWLGEARSKARFKALPPEPIKRLEADPRRLRAEPEDTETRSTPTAKHHRVQAPPGA